MSEEQWLPGGPMNLIWMAFPVVVMGLAGWSATRDHNRLNSGAMLFYSAALGFAFFLDGWYWSIFPRGVGFFTANRMSALCVFFLLFAVPYIFVRRRRTREWREHRRVVRDDLDRKAQVKAENAEREPVWPGVAYMDLTPAEKEAEMARFAEFLRQLPPDKWDRR
ncbi:MAG: hypothetical protein ACOY5R_06540 [Pseudomonadota bacterium]